MVQIWLEKYKRICQIKNMAYFVIFQLKRAPRRFTTKKVTTGRGPLCTASLINTIKTIPFLLRESRPSSIPHGTMWNPPRGFRVDCRLKSIRLCSRVFPVPHNTSCMAAVFYASAHADWPTDRLIRSETYIQKRESRRSLLLYPS